MKNARFNREKLIGRLTLVSRHRALDMRSRNRDFHVHGVSVRVSGEEVYLCDNKEDRRTGEARFRIEFVLNLCMHARASLYASSSFHYRLRFSLLPSFSLSLCFLTLFPFFPFSIDEKKLVLSLSHFILFISVYARVYTCVSTSDRLERRRSRSKLEN